MREFAFVVPGDPASLTGGYIYARRVIDALPACGWQPRPLHLPGDFPFPSAATLNATAGTLGALVHGTVALIDGLAFGAIPTDILRACPAALVALIHHPLAAEGGLSDAAARALYDSERAALALAARVITTSSHTARALVADYAVPAAHITVAPPGTDLAARAHGSGGVPNLLAVATLTPRKGHDILLRALAQVRDLPWSLTCLGSLARDPATAAAIRVQIAALGLSDRVVLTGEASGAELGAAYEAADIFVLASRHEGYGMAFAEALARGLPVIGCKAGAVSETVPAEAGLLTPVDDIDALAQALRRLLTDGDLRARMSAAAWKAGQALTRWPETARLVGDALAAVSKA